MTATPFLAAALLIAITLASQAPPAPPPAAPAAVQLVYEMPIDALQRTLRGTPDRDLEQVLAETVATVRARLPVGTKVTRHAASGFTVELPAADAPAVAAARATIETAGKLEMRMLAHADYVAPGVAFDLPQERQRLQTWLDAGGRERLRADPQALGTFHDDALGGRLAGKNLRWFVRRIAASTDAVGRWGMRYQDIPPCRDVCVPAYLQQDWNDGSIPPHIQALPADQRFLVELFAVNMHETHFDNSDLDPNGCRVDHRTDGPMLLYRIVASRAGEYADWSQKHLRKCSAILWNDELLSAPMFVSRIPGLGAIAGSFTVDELEAMCAVLQSPPLLMTPVFVRIDSIGK